MRYNRMSLGGSSVCVNDNFIQVGCVVCSDWRNEQGRSSKLRELTALPSSDGDRVNPAPEEDLDWNRQHHAAASSIGLINTYGGPAVDADGRVPPPGVGCQELNINERRLDMTLHVPLA